MLTTDSAMPSFTAQRQYWDDRWSRTPEPGPWQVRRGQTILSVIRGLGLKNPRILDYGCGTGWFTDQLASIGPAVGVDLSEAAIGFAREQYHEATYVAANLFELSLPMKAFDIIVSQEVIAHVVDPKEYIGRITAMLEPGGYLILTTANKTVMDRLIHPPDPEAHIKNWLGLREVRTLFGSRYDILRHTSIIPRGTLGFLRLVNSATLNKALQVLLPEATIEAFKERMGWGYTLIVLARRTGTVAGQR